MKVLMDWDTFRSKLGLDETQADQIRELLDFYKKQYSELCSRISRRSKLSPLEFMAKLHRESVDKDLDIINEKYRDFLAGEEEFFSHVSYEETGLQLDYTCREKLYDLLNEKQKIICAEFKIESMLNIVTGFDPFKEKLNALITGQPGGLGFQVEGVEIDELLADIHETRKLLLSGGEPLLNPCIMRLIDVLINRRLSQNVDLRFVTNFTVLPGEFINKMTEFRSVTFFLSVDGVGPVYEYINYPAKWENITLNLRHVSQNTHFSFIFQPVIQNYNILTITALLEYAESLNLPCKFNILSIPPFLSVRVLPYEARMLAIKRLTQYLKISTIVESFPDMVLSIEKTIHELKQETEYPYIDLMEDFITFTTELDRSRNQSVREMIPELYDFIFKDGFMWDRKRERDHTTQGIWKLSKKNVHWATLRNKLALDRIKATKIETILNEAKDRYTEICLHPSAEEGKSPLEFAGNLMMSSPHPEGESFSTELVKWLSERRESTTNRTYLNAIRFIEQATERAINRLLSEEKRKTLQKLNIDSLINITTGYDPFKEKLTEKIDELKVAQFTAKKEHKFRGYFCPVPFEYLTVCDNGDVYLCSACKMWIRVGNLSKQSLDSLWNSELADKVRQAVLDGSYRYCNVDECEYLQDRKLKKNSEFKNTLHRDIISQQLTILKTGPRVIEVSYDKSCNLSCPYCRQEHLMAKGSELTRLRRLHDQVFGNQLKGVERIMLSGCGEPLSSQLFRDMLRNFDRTLYPQARIKLQTNGLSLTPSLWKSISSSHGIIDWISISIDAATRKTYSLNRSRNFDKLLKNLEFISGLRKNKSIQTLNINFVVQANNFKEMKQFIVLGQKYGCDYIIFQRIMNIRIDYGLHSEKNYTDLAVHLESHPHHAEFLEVMKDPVFMEPRIGLFKLLEFLPADKRKAKDVDSIIKYYPRGERKRMYR
ncbi:radical SAM protein [candidate division CSSED10-310 bacterium]|uniref:Radical SAM protein n=1 Tax=candidate division CSSED10-310 bacterium TaxID=2855610 RepID=A0ABV6YQU8_UNCC1